MKEKKINRKRLARQKKRRVKQNKPDQDRYKYADKEIRLTETENQACWNWAKEAMKIRPKKEEVNKHVFCPVCKQGYCLGFDNVDQFCRDCFYMKNKDKPLEEGMFFSGCTKEMTGRRICQHCR